VAVEAAQVGISACASVGSAAVTAWRCRSFPATLCVTGFEGRRPPRCSFLALSSRLPLSASGPAFLPLGRKRTRASKGKPFAD
jgi:hypothetical protein